MAVKSEIDNNDLLGIDSEIKELMESVEWDMSDVEISYEYRDGQKTDTQTATTWILIGPRKGDKRIRNKELRLKSNEVLEQSIIDAYKESGATVKLSNLNVKSIWANSEKGSTFANVNVSISGDVEVIPDED